MNRISTALAAICLVAPAAAWAQGSTPATTKAPRLGEPRARSLLLDYGCNNVSTLSMDNQGSWYGSCVKGGQTVSLKVDQQGKVERATGVTHITEPHARSAMMNYGCNNVSRLSRSPQGTWHGSCTKGGQTVNLMVDQKGAVSPSTGAGYITEAHARSALMNAGCNNVSSLSMDTDGTWDGTCTKGGRTVTMEVDQQGKVASR